MSTKVYNLIAEQRRPRSPFADRKILTKNGSKTKRALFGPVDHNECTEFLKREHDLNSKMWGQKWGFDLNKGRPMNDGRYEWKEIKVEKRPPPPLRIQQEHDNSDLYCEPAEIEKATPIREDENLSMNDVNINNGNVRNENTRQCLITDYMSIRKRGVNAAFVKKTADASSAPRPSKMARSNDVVS